MADPTLNGMARWLVERFPPVVYTALVAAFAYGAGALAVLDGGRWTWIPAIVGWLFFLQLRIFDEHKDFEDDRVAYPERVLSKGEVTLNGLARLGVFVVIAQLILASLSGGHALALWACAFAFSVTMLYEFGIGEWLSKRLLLYAITHNPVVGLLAAYMYLASDPAPNLRFLGFVGLASASSLAVEVGRKLRLPDEEIQGVPSYTTELGQRGARGTLIALHLLTGLLVGWTATAYGATWGWVGLVVAIPGIITSIGLQPAKRVELGASLTLLAALLFPGMAA